MKKNCFVFLATLIFSVCFSSCKDLIDEFTKVSDMTFVNKTDKPIFITYCDRDTEPDTPIGILPNSARKIGFGDKWHDTTFLFSYNNAIYKEEVYPCDDFIYCVYIGSDNQLCAMFEDGKEVHPTKISN